MKSETREILNDPSLVAARDVHLQRLQVLFDGAILSTPFYLWGYRGRGQADPYREPEQWLDEALEDLAIHAHLLRDDRVFRPLVIGFGPFGVHFVDRILGADVFDLDGEQNWQVRPLATDVGTLMQPDLERDPTWHMAREMALAFCARDVAVPLFGLPTIASALNVAVNLYGDRILTAMLLEPEEARHDLELINSLLCDLHRWYMENVPASQLQPVVAAMRTQPPGFGQLCGCTTHLLSAGLYRQFVAALDEALLAVYPGGGMIHLCGAHVQHIPTWREMGALRAVQLNDRAADDLATYWSGLRHDQIVYINVYDDLPLDRALEITGGHRAVIVTEPNA